MNFADSFQKRLFHISDKNFEDAVFEAFDYQYSQCKTYRLYCEALKKSPKEVKKIDQIPFLPIEFFKNHVIKSGAWETTRIFKSSGTTATRRSVHHIKEVSFYTKVASTIYRRFFGSLANTTIIALLPSYREQGDSSLVKMIDHFIRFAAPDSGYFSNNQKELVSLLNAPTKKKWMIGVSFALLDLIESNRFSLENTVVMETGGMKGRRKEITRRELHLLLRKGFGRKEIFSEYGMTELLSQAYGSNGFFTFPAWAKTLIRDINDPFCYLSEGKTGGINIIDLANINSCCFVETKDLGRIRNKGFEVLGRYDNSDIRGCNLMS